MASLWSLSAMMIVVGGLGVSGALSHRTVSTAAWVIAVLLITSGAALFTRHALAFYFALAAALLMAVGGVLALAGHPGFALLGHPYLTIGAALYLGLRLALAMTMRRRPSSGEPIV
jgi:hypothetical protein